MKTDLPIILGAGIFDSRLKFPNKSLTSIRTVTEYEIELFCSDGGVSHINGSEHAIKKGNILVARPGDRRQSSLHFTCCFIHFTTENQKIIRLLSSLPEFFNIYEYTNYEKYFTDIYDFIAKNDEYAPVICGARLYELIYNIYKKSNLLKSTEKTENQTYSVVSNAFDYINRHYQEQINAEAVAESCNVSQSYLYKLFSRVAQTTPNEYINRVRLAAAKSALISGNESLCQIAISCGFGSQAYFCYVFKKANKISPGKFRKSFEYPE